MKALFWKAYIGMVLTLLLGIFLSEYFINHKNYKESLRLDHQYLVESVLLHIKKELSDVNDHEKVFAKWEEITGYNLYLATTEQLKTLFEQYLDLSPQDVDQHVNQLGSLEFDEFTIAMETSFSEDRVMMASPMNSKDLWLVFAEIDRNSVLDYRIFAVNQVVLIVCFSFALFIFMRPFVLTINSLKNALKRFSEGDLNIEVSEVGPSPLKKLSAQFNQMAIALNEKIDQQKLMTNAMSHELKSPITRLRFALDMAIKSDTHSEVMDLLSEMDIDLVDLDELTTDLLTLAKASEGSEHWTFQLLDIKPMFQREIDRLEKYEKNRDCVIIGDAQASVSGLHLERVVSNIVGNSFKYAKKQIRISLSNRNDRCYIVIEDDGEGVANEQLASLFAPFARVDSSRNRETGGHGLGLAIVWNIIKHHKGSVSAGSSALGGLRVEIDIPCAR